jgi:hypothetical protein
MTAIPTIEATIPVDNPPSWAVWERALFAAMDAAVAPFLAKYTRPDGTLIFRDDWPNGRDGADDLYESMYNWPLLYLLGGGDHLLDLAHRQWDAITRQATAYGLVEREYERGYDQFHQGESYIAFYFLCLADPTNPTLLARARRFVEFYTGDDPAAPNYDPEHRIIRAPHNGSAGPRPGIGDGEPSYRWSPGMAIYGLPFADIPGIAGYDDLRDPDNARRMGEAMRERMGRGDVAANLAVTSLVANAYLLTGDERYRRWTLDYTDAWMARARENGGLLPDNVGLSGGVGEYLGGRWYGGLYGWTWPHGFYNIGMAALIAGANAFLLSRDPAYLDLPRALIDQIWERGEWRAVEPSQMSLGHHWAHLLDGRETAYLVPYRHGDGGWFDYQPLHPAFPMALWALSMAEDDRERVARLDAPDAPSWTAVRSFRTKEENGHEQPWFRFLAGDLPDYPEALLRATYAQVCRRLALIRADAADLLTVNIHHWQELNPILTEALVQLTLGAPQHIYNGGLLHARVRYWDDERRRPGLPPDVAALVETLEESRTVLQLVNLSPLDARTVIVTAGTFGEGRFGTARYSARTSDYPGPQRTYAAPPLATTWRDCAVTGPALRVVLPPATTITLDLPTARYANMPSYAPPWDAEGGAAPDKS